MFWYACGSHHRWSGTNAASEQVSTAQRHQNMQMQKCFFRSDSEQGVTRRKARKTELPAPEGLVISVKGETSLLFVFYPDCTIFLL